MISAVVHAEMGSFVFEIGGVGAGLSGSVLHLTVVPDILAVAVQVEHGEGSIVPVGHTEQLAG